MEKKKILLMGEWDLVFWLQGMLSFPSNSTWGDVGHHAEAMQMVNTRNLEQFLMQESVQSVQNRMGYVQSVFLDQKYQNCPNFFQPLPFPHLSMWYQMENQRNVFYGSNIPDPVFPSNPRFLQPDFTENSVEKVTFMFVCDDQKKICME